MTTRLIKYALTVVVACWAARQWVRSSRRCTFTDRSVLITGGSRGLGLVMARQLAAEGARIAICATDADELERAKRELLEVTSHVIAERCDVTNQDEVCRLVKHIESEWGGVDVLINNAGVIQVGPQAKMALKDYEDAFALHLWAPLFTTLAVLPGMKRRRSGRIVNISSIGGKLSVPHMLPYSASKFALVGLSEGLRAELLQEGIYVTTVCPGLMRTGSHVNAKFKGEQEIESAWFSTSASAPLISASAENAADQIITACREGRSHLLITWPAYLASLVHGVSPGLVTDTFAIVNRLLPSGGETVSRDGGSSRPWWLPRLFTYLGDRAALRNNEVSPESKSEPVRK